MSEEEKMPSTSRLHAVVHGHVQGVNFRAYTLRTAVNLGLKGWVRNVPDGTVETIAEGENSALQSYLDFLNTGPPSAVVTHVDMTWADATGEFDDFHIHYSHFW